MLKLDALFICAALALPVSGWASEFAIDTSIAAPVRESAIDIEVDEGVTDPRGDESPDPRTDDLLCDNVVCGDEGPTCTTCGKSAE